MDFSVAIRTYNRAARLPGLFAALRSQTFAGIGQHSASAFSWEVVVVDNNSTDGTAALVRQLAPTLPVPVRYVLEPRQGASFARQRAVAESRGRFIGFLDDDNLPAADWVWAAYRFGLDHPRAAAFGSQIHGSYEVPPPAGFERIAPFLPVVERSHDVCFTAGKRRLSNLVPPGAGLVVRRDFWLQSVPSSLILKGPIASALMAKGEDTEALLHLKKAGWEIWFHAQMHIFHLIPQERLERSYLVRFFQGIGRSRYTTRTVAYQPWLRWPMVLLHGLNDLRKLLTHWLSRPAAEDLAAACERALLSSSLLSPLTQLSGKGLGGVGRARPNRSKMTGLGA